MIARKIISANFGMTDYSLHPRPKTTIAAVIEEIFRIGAASGSDRRHRNSFAVKITLATARGTDPVAMRGAVCINSRCGFNLNTIFAPGFAYPTMSAYED
ncbi:MAG: hypothetical protein ACREAB_08040 [Blastocatellia bacterium]